MTRALLIVFLSGWAALGLDARPPEECPCTDASVRNVRDPLTLSAAASEALVFQIEEERMARELYTEFGQKWELRPFLRIQRAEQRHEQLLRALAERAGLKLPAPTPGRFTSPTLQERYADLRAAGLVSASAALATGAAVERQDLADLEALIASTDSAELQSLARVLEAASRRHLAAFTGDRGAGRGRGARWGRPGAE